MLTVQIQILCVEATHVYHSHHVRIYLVVSGVHGVHARRCVGVVHKQDQWAHLLEHGAQHQHNHNLAIQNNVAQVVGGVLTDILMATNAEIRRAHTHVRSVQRLQMITKVPGYGSKTVLLQGPPCAVPAGRPVH